MAKYWLGRYLAIKKAQLSKAKRYEDDYRKRMAETQKAIEAEMDSWIARYAKEDGTLDPLEAKKLLRGKDLKEWKYTLAEWEAMAKEGGYEKEMNLEYYKSRVSRLKELEGQLAIIMTKPTRKEMTALEDLLTNTHKETYLKTIFTRQMQTSSISKAFNRLDPNTVQALVRNGWQGSNFSERIWQNSTQKLPKMLTESLFSGMVLGQSKDEIQQTLKHRLKGFTDNDIHRLVITESAYITEQATDLAYDETGVDKIEWIAALEIHTCDTPIEVDGKTYKGCRGLDGQVFTRSRKLLLPPAHPFCRCTTAPWDEILDEIEFSRWARDPVTGKSVDTHAVKFDEWQEMVGLKPQSADKESEFIVAKLGEHLTKEKMYGVDPEPFLNTLNSAPTSFKKAWEKYQHTFKLLDKPDKISYFSPFGRQVSLPNLKNQINDQLGFSGKSLSKRKFSTFFHEFGHAMDYEVSEKGFASSTVRLENGLTLAESVYNEGQDKLKVMHNQLKKAYIENDKSAGRYEVEGVTTLLFADQRTVSKKEVVSLMLKRLEKLVTDEAEKIQDEYPDLKYNFADTGTITDLYGGITGGKINNKSAMVSGHRKKYWAKNKQMENIGTEAFAEFSAAVVVGGRELELIKEWFPESLESYYELIDKIGRE